MQKSILSFCRVMPGEPAQAINQSGYRAGSSLVGSIEGDPVSKIKSTTNLMPTVKIPQSHLYTEMCPSTKKWTEGRERETERQSVRQEHVLYYNSLNMRQRRQSEKGKKKKNRKFEASSRERTKPSKTLVLSFQLFQPWGELWILATGRERNQSGRLNESYGLLISLPQASHLK